jgi:hypothetical protein
LLRERLFFKNERSFSLREILRKEINRSFFKIERMASKNETLI